MNPELPRKRNVRTHRSFAAALRGLGTALARERNLRVHFAAAALALYLARFYSFTRGEKAALFLCIGLVLATELLNTAVEYAVDLYTNHQYNAVAGASKDVAAGAVFVSALVSVGVGLLLFRQREPVAAVLADMRTYPLKWVLLALLALAWIILPGLRANKEKAQEAE